MTHGELWEQAKRELASLGITMTRKAGTNEIRINYVGGQESTAAYVDLGHERGDTRPIEEALATGRLLARARETLDGLIPVLYALQYRIPSDVRESGWSNWQAEYYPTLAEAKTEQRNLPNRFMDPPQTRIVRYLISGEVKDSVDNG